MKKILIGFIIIIVFVPAWEFVWWALGVNPLLPWHLKAALKANAEDFDLVDVRTPSEYRLFHISGTKNQPELLLHPKLFKAQDPRKPLVIMCMTGHRSSVVAYRLKKQGFTEVHNLTFGMLGWLLSGGETTGQKEESKRRRY